MRSLLALGVVVLVACGSSVRGTQEFARAPSSQLNEAWLAKDLECSAQLCTALDARNLSVEDLKRVLKSCDVREERAIGFGSQRLLIAVYGGYTTTWVHVLGETRVGEHDARVAGMRVEQMGSHESWNLIRERLRLAWKRPMRDVEFGLATQRDDAKLAQELRERTADALGGRIESRVPDELAASFELLTSPFEDLAVGKSFGDDGAPPFAARASKQLVDAQRFDLVSAALRGLNPEGRVYAAYALRARGKLDQKDETAIEKLRELDVEITTADGCIVEHKKFDAALAMLSD
jgi:hypothetical protein